MMSYLLTEISLEMLGYKFYDVDGIYHETNFQHSGPHPKSNCEEHSLRYYLGMEKSSENEESTANEIIAEPSENVDRAALKPKVRVFAAPSKNSQRSSTTQSKTSPPNRSLSNQSLNIELSSSTRSLPSALSKILDYEYQRIRGQVIRKIQHNAQENITDNIEKSLSQQEEAKLNKEVEIVQEFRKMVEQRLMKTNPKPFEKYVRTFSVKKEAVNGEVCTIK